MASQEWLCIHFHVYIICNIFALVESLKLHFTLWTFFTLFGPWTKATHQKKGCNCMEGLVFYQTSFCSFLDICDQILNIHFICHYFHLEIVVYSIKCYTTNVARFLGLHFILLFMECYLFIVSFSLTNKIVVNKVVCIISIIPYRSKLLSSLIFMY